MAFGHHVKRAKEIKAVRESAGRAELRRIQDKEKCYFCGARNTEHRVLNHKIIFVCKSCGPVFRLMNPL